MNAILFTKIFDKQGEQLVKTLQDSLNEIKIKVVYSLYDVVQNLRGAMQNSTVVLLHAASHDSLDDIMLIREKLGGTRIILILPDEEDDTVAKGHLLRPRFISTVNCDFNNILAVLNKMESNEKSERRAERRRISREL